MYLSDDFSCNISPREPVFHVVEKQISAGHCKLNKTTDVWRKLKLGHNLVSQKNSNKIKTTKNWQLLKSVKTC